jgi:hypothetical protein
VKSFFRILNRITVFVFIFFFSAIENIYGQERNPEEQRIITLLKIVESENRYVEELIDKNLTNLPIGIRKTINGTTITIAIDSASLRPEGMMVNAYSQIELPGTGKKLCFAAHNVFVTPSGISQQASARLELITEAKISFNDRLTLILPVNGRNYIEWDCYGFRSVSFNGHFEFADDLFISDPEYSKSDKVTASFETSTSDLNNILVSTTISPFRINGLGDMTFIIMNASVDMSDFVNCDGFAMPKGYYDVFSDEPRLWRGFFLKDVTVVLPSEFNKSSGRVKVSASNLLIDDFGISGYFSATNVLTIEEGNAAGWPFSVTSFEFGLMKNNLVETELKGFFKVPFLGEEPFAYTAQVMSRNNRLEYQFNINTPSDMEYSAPLGGKVRLNKNCEFIVNVKNGKFIPSAILSGILFIDDGVAKIDGLRFERLHLTAESPYIIGGKFESSGDMGFTLAGFGMSVDSVSLDIKSGKATLAFNVKLALMNKSDKGVSAVTRLLVNASVVTGTDNNERQKWIYDGLTVQGVNVKGNVSLFSLSGNVFIFYDHPVYGNGFKGNLNLTVGKLIRDSTTVEVYFGNKTDYRYWFAKIDIQSKIPIGAMTLKNIGGGAYSNMERSNSSIKDYDYIPKKDAGLGLIAEVGLYVKNEKVFNADAVLEIAINKSGGVRFIRFSGEGCFFTNGNEKTNDVATIVTATINMVYDNENNSFHANLNVFMNVLNAIKGIGPDGLLGEAVIHSDPSDWYVFIGRPSAPVGVEVLGLLKTQVYFMAGTKIEDMPLPPSEVASIISNIDLDFMKDERSIATGRGFAFGIQFKANAGIGQNNGFIYAYFKAGAGADILLQNYGNSKCEGRSGQIGINGWYASGQGYAFLTGKIGIRVKKSEFDIMSVAAALLVQAKVPNPSWFRGNIAARYSILGGLIRGKVNVAVTLGEECVLVSTGNELAELNIIGDIMPEQGNNDVSVFVAPQVSFNTIIDKEFGMVNLMDKYSVYRVRLDGFELSTSDNKVIPGAIQWNDSHDMATMKLNDILPGTQTINTNVRIRIEKMTNAGWQTISDTPETRQISFKTGEEPITIPESNVSFSYPLNNQYNFYSKEYPKGYIKLKNGQPDLFKAQSEGNNWIYLARFNNSGKISETNLTYDNAGAIISFDLPDDLAKSSIYDFTIVKKPVSVGAIDRNLQRSEVLITDFVDSLSISNTNITGTIAASGTVTVLYSLSFRTSKYLTFAEKLNSINSWNMQLTRDNSTGMLLPQVEASLDETFDRYENENSKDRIGSLIILEALVGNEWLDTHVNPQVYELYGTSDLKLDRNTDDLGIIPLKAMCTVNTGYNSYLLNSPESSFGKGFVYFIYQVPHYVYSDFIDLRNKAVSKYLNTTVVPSLQAQRLMAGTIDNIYKGKYPFRISYRLPGLNILTTSREYDIVY